MPEDMVAARAFVSIELLEICSHLHVLKNRGEEVVLTVSWGVVHVCVVDDCCCSCVEGLEAAA